MPFKLYELQATSFKLVIELVFIMAFNVEILSQPATLVKVLV